MGSEEFYANIFMHTVFQKFTLNIMRHFINKQYYLKYFYFIYLVAFESRKPTILLKVKSVLAENLLKNCIFFSVFS